MVLDGQLEVGEGDSDEGGDDEEDDEDDEEDAVDGVHLVAPHAGKDVVPVVQQLQSLHDVHVTHKGGRAQSTELSMSASACLMLLPPAIFLTQHARSPAL